MAGGALQESQSYMHMPTPGSTAEKLSHLHSVCSIHVVFTLSFSHDVGSCDSQVFFVEMVRAGCSPVQDQAQPCDPACTHRDCCWHTNQHSRDLA